MGFWYFQPYHPIIPLPITAAYACLHFLLNYLEIKIRNAKEANKEQSEYAEKQLKLRNCLYLHLTDGSQFHRLSEDDYISFLQDSLLQGCGAPLDIARSATALKTISSTSSKSRSSKTIESSSPYRKFVDVVDVEKNNKQKVTNVDAATDATSTMTTFEKLSIERLTYKTQYENLLQILHLFYIDKVAKDALMQKSKDLIKGTKVLVDLMKQKKFMKLIDIILSTVSDDCFESTAIESSSSIALSSNAMGIDTKISEEPLPKEPESTDQQPEHFDNTVVIPTQDIPINEEEQYEEDGFEEHEEETQQ